MFAQLRMRKNLTQQAVADVLGVKRSTVAMWELGKSLPRADKLRALAILYETTTDELLKEPTAPDAE